jgi:hypothetical protein
MQKSGCLIAIGIVLLIMRAASAADRVSVQLLEERSVAFPTTRPATPPASSLEDEKPALSVETIIDSNRAFLAECIVDGKTIHLSGTATPASDGACQVNVNFSCGKPSDLEQVQSAILIRPGEQNQIGGFSGGGKSTRVMLEIKHEQK